MIDCYAKANLNNTFGNGNGNWLVMEIEESKEVVLLGIIIDNLLTFN